MFKQAPAFCRCKHLQHTNNNSVPSSRTPILGRAPRKLVRTKKFASMNTYMEVQVFDYFNPKHMNRCLHQTEIVTILKTLQVCHSTLISLLIFHIPEGLVSHCFSGYNFHSFCLQPLIPLKGKIKIPSPSILLFLGSQSFTFWADKHFLAPPQCLCIPLSWRSFLCRINSMIIEQICKQMC